MCWIRILIDFQKMKCIFIWPLSEIQEINKGWKVKNLALPSERSHQHPSWFLQSGRLLLWLLEYAKKLGLILIDWSKVELTWNTAISHLPRVSWSKYIRGHWDRLKWDTKDFEDLESTNFWPQVRVWVTRETRCSNQC